MTRLRINDVASEEDRMLRIVAGYREGVRLAELVQAFGRARATTQERILSLRQSRRVCKIGSGGSRLTRYCLPEYREATQAAYDASLKGSPQKLAYGREWHARNSGNKQPSARKPMPVASVWDLASRMAA